MQWSDIDLNAKEWRYLVTKTNAQHIVPLSTQAIAILETIKPLTVSCPENITYIAKAV
jgi:integrase